jgi:hypothetical protein
MPKDSRERYKEEPSSYYDRNQEYFGPEYDGGYDPGRDRFVRTPEWEEGQYPEDRRHKTYFRSTFQTNPFGAQEQQKGPSGWNTQGPHAGKGPKGYKKTDERIYEEVCELLMSHPLIDARDIEVSVKGGIVTLSGTVTGRPSKRLSEDLAAAVPGVSDVQNQLSLSPTRWADESHKP